MSLEGKKAPDFNLEASDGTRRCLADYAGRTVVIYFYPRDNTPGCTKEACGFRDLHKNFVDGNVVVLGVSKDSITSHDKFIRDFNLPFVLLSDPETSMMRSYQAFGEKVQYGKTTLGTIRSTVIVGPDGTVLRHWTRVAKAETHPASVLEFLMSRGVI